MKKQPESLPKKDKIRLIALGKKLEKLEEDRQSLMVDARKIIGVDEPDVHLGIDEELEDAWGQADDYETVFVEYANICLSEWAKEEAIDRIKAIMSESGIKIDDIQEAK
jgi:hypothetical protein